ncbi:MAG: 3-dehydroquinate synthase [Elusimicrobia bacterium]|nr:3-dehydroquinate synthase [Elusimicrobiota bacterium]
MKIINVKLKQNSYPIILSNSYADLLSKVKKFSPEKKIFIITDTNVSKIYLKEILSLLKKENFIVERFAFEAGEKSKNINTLTKIYNYALKIGIDRKYTVIALGGGVVGDTAGLFASTYMRGLKFVQMPTSLLAMVDSSIGGKTGIDLEGGKNIVGTFYQPKFVYINSNFIKTLKSEHIQNGMGEVIKYAITFSNKFFNELETILNKSIVSKKDFDKIIYESCKFKAKIVEEDEKERKGVRELLNFGHTFGHALETATKYKKYLHGEAVVIGMLFVAELSNRIKFCTEQTKQKIKEIVVNAGFNTEIKLKTDAKTLLELMKKDKKSVSKKIRFVLPEKIGKARTGMEIDDNIILNTIKDFIK